MTLNVKLDRASNNMIQKTWKGQRYREYEKLPHGLLHPTASHIFFVPSPYVGELQKPREGGPIFFSAGGGLIFQTRGGQGGSFQNFSLEFHGVILINKNIEK